MNRLRADALLLFAAVIWGTTFVAQKQANGLIGPITFVGLRFLLTAIVVGPLALREAGRAPVPVARRDRSLAVGIGIALGAGAILQQVGLLTTTVTKGGFLTAIYLVLVPWVGWLTARTPVRLAILGASGVSIAGAFLLAGHVDLSAWSPGDLVVLLADVAWALQITGVSRFLSRSARPFFLVFVESLVAGAAAVALALLVEPIALDPLRRALFPILYAGVLSGGVAFTIQVVAQQHTPAAEASLLMALESVFAAGAGAVVFHERLTPRALAGCALILLGALAVELYPALAEARRSAGAQPPSPVDPGAPASTEPPAAGSLTP